MRKTLRIEYQKPAFDAAMQAMNASSEPILINATVGAGKSLLAAYFLETMELNGMRGLCLTMTSELVSQNAQEYDELGRRCGVYCAGLNRKEYNNPVIFGSAQSVWSGIRAGRKIKDQKFDLLVIDECITGDSTITTDKGGMRIDDPDLVNARIKCVNEDTGQFFYHKPRKVLHNGVKSISQYKTRDGSIKCTSTHKIYSTGSWVQAGSLKVGQKIAFDGSQDFVMKKAFRALAAAAAELCRYLKEVSHQYINSTANG